MKAGILGLWVAVALLLLPEALSLDIETDKLNYKAGETISVSVSENSRIEYNNIVKHGSYAEFKADKLDNRILVNNEYEKLIYVSDGKIIGTCLNLGIFGVINIFIFKIMRKCLKMFI
jgi:hypothetical protein